MEIKTLDITYRKRDYDRSTFINARVLSVEVDQERVTVELEDNRPYRESVLGYGSDIAAAVRDAGLKLEEG